MTTNRPSGPKTPAGKARASQNALKHGLSSKQVLLPTESAEEFAALRASYFETLQPTNPLEAELVETLAATRWRLRRLATIEANLFNNYILENADDFMDDSLSTTGDEGRIAWSFKKLAEQAALPLLVRYEATLTRSYDRTFKQLRMLRQERQKEILVEEKQEEAKQQNELPPPAEPAVAVQSPNQVSDKSTDPRPSACISGPSQPASDLTAPAQSEAPPRHSHP